MKSPISLLFRAVAGTTRFFRKNVFSYRLAVNTDFSGGFEKKMTEREAMLILNLSTTQDFRLIKEQHKKLLMTNHPDKGGSTFLAFKINEAKDHLTKKSF